MVAIAPRIFLWILNNDELYARSKSFTNRNSPKKLGMNGGISKPAIEDWMHPWLHCVLYNTIIDCPKEDWITKKLLISSVLLKQKKKNIIKFVQLARIVHSSRYPRKCCSTRRPLGHPPHHRWSHSWSRRVPEQMILLPHLHLPTCSPAAAVLAAFPCCSFEPKIRRNSRLR